uniref:Exostosin GT47 domain-containing protein n=1 Tax=Aureoumbra lagunensis TaxID=44058 RepID=A0A7S3K5T6_9STRA|mmetsp:Transcript_20181/g.30746  ORF Transcript_20181/g.30746 Transcript_20181/m.30746 type:complete len:450 (+) Transcript_20181:71-1420(+)
MIRLVLILQIAQSILHASDAKVLLHKNIEESGGGDDDGLRESFRRYIGFKRTKLQKRSIGTWEELGLVNDNFGAMFCGWNGIKCTVKMRIDHQYLVDSLLLPERWTAKRFAAVRSWREELLGPKSLKKNISRPIFWIPLSIHNGKLENLVAFFEYIVFKFLVPDTTIKSFTLLTLPFPIGEHGSPWERHQYGAVATAYSDFNITSSEEYLRRYLQIPKLAAWFILCHSPLPDEPKIKSIADGSRWILHRKLRQIPIGVSHNAAHAGFLDAWNAPLKPRDKLLYINFRYHAHRKQAAQAVIHSFRAFGLDNEYPITHLNCSALDPLQNSPPQQNTQPACDVQRTYYSDILRSRFVLSPPGSKLDCHRHWEILMLGAIPIILRSPPLIEMFAGLPVLFVSDWSEVTPARLMTEAVHIYSIFNYDWRPLTVTYWRHQIWQAAGGHVNDDNST